jgi:probable phosphoglycerate mutase
MSTRMLLVRHGQSAWNAQGRWQGQADPVLSELGRRQARAAAASLMPRSLQAIWASDLRRAAETAAIIADELGVGPAVLDPDLRERDAGEWSGLTRAEIEERYPGYLDPPPPTGAPAHDDTSKHTSFGGAPAGSRPRRPPGWESDDHLLERAVRALHRIVSAVPDGDVLVVTHGGLIYRVEGQLGAGFARLSNMEGRWVEASGQDVTGTKHDGVTLRLGERVLLAQPDEAPVTTPRQL